MAVIPLVPTAPSLQLKMKKNWFASGDWNFICEVCGFKRKASDGLERWDGLMVCKPTLKPGCWETRHPQELIRPVPDQQKLPWTRPESTDTYVQLPNMTAGCTISNSQAVAGLAVAGCAIAGRDFGIRDSLADVEDFH